MRKYLQLIKYGGTQLWHIRPIGIALLGLVAGVICFEYFTLSILNVNTTVWDINSITLAFVLGVIGATSLYFSNRFVDYRSTYLFRLSIFCWGLTWFNIGYFNTELSYKLPANSVIHYKGLHLSFKGIAESEMQYHKYGKQIFVKIVSASDGVTTHLITGKVLLNVPSKILTHLVATDSITFQGTVTDLSTIKNQGYAQYLRRKGVVAKIKARSLNRLGKHKDIWAQLVQIRQF